MLLILVILLHLLGGVFIGALITYLSGFMFLMAWETSRDLYLDRLERVPWRRAFRSKMERTIQFLVIPPLVLLALLAGLTLPAMFIEKASPVALAGGVVGFILVAAFVLNARFASQKNG